MKKNDTFELNRIGNYYGEQFGTSYAGNVWDSNFICPAILTCQGGGREAHILEIKDDIYTTSN